MPDIRISQLNPVTALGATDELPIVQGVGSTPVTKQITGQQLADGIVTLKGLASTSYVNTAVSNLVAGAPDLLNTLKELADAIGDNPNFVTVVNGKLNSSDFNTTANTWFATTSTRNLAEDTNLYFTTARARAAISVGTPGAATGGGALSYNNGVFTFTPAATYVLPTASHTVLGGVKVDGTTITINNGVISGANTWANITDINNSNGPTHIAIGQNAGETGGGYGSAGANSIAIGTNSGRQNQGGLAVSIGSNAGKLSQQGASIAIGNAAGFDSQGSQSIAGGWMAGYDHQGANAVAIGTGAGKITQGAATVAIGWNAGETNQGANAIAIGEEAGSSNQHANSIVINASGNALDSTDAGLYINPIRSASSTNNVIYYNITTKEVTYGAPIFTTVTTTNLNVQNLTFTGTGPVTFTSGNDLNFVAAGAISFNGQELQNSVRGFLTNNQFLTLDNIQVGFVWSPGATDGNFGLKIRTVSGQLTQYFTGHSTGIAANIGGMGYLTTAGVFIYGAGILAEGDGNNFYDTSIFYLTDTTNKKFYRITLNLVTSYSSNIGIIVEKLI